MRRNSSDRDRPIFVFPRKAKIGIPEAPAYSSSASSSSTSITIHASAEPEASDKKRATGKRRGEAAEAAFLARATHLGFRVLLPWGESNPYDAAVDYGRGLLRVQVKSAGPIMPVIRSRPPEQMAVSIPWTISISWWDTWCPKISGTSFRSKPWATAAPSNSIRTRGGW